MKSPTPLNKKMVLTINHLCTSITGGYSAGTNNLRAGATLGFVEQIFINEVFGTKIYPSLHEQAAAYLFHVVKDHVFLDGNKRTGLSCALTFLQWNGYHIEAMDENASYDFVMAIAAGPNTPDTQIPKIAAWLRSISTPLKAPISLP